MRGEHGVGVVCNELLGSDFEVSDSVGMVSLEIERKMGLLADSLKPR